MGVYFRPGAVYQKSLISNREFQVTEERRFSAPLAFGATYQNRYGDLIEFELMGSVRSTSAVRTISNEALESGYARMAGLRLAYGFQIAMSALDTQTVGRHHAVFSFDARRWDVQAPEQVVAFREYAHSRDLGFNAGYRFVGEVSRNFAVFIGVQTTLLRVTNTVKNEGFIFEERDAKARIFSSAGVEAG